VEVQKNKIQLYCNQVFVTDSVEGIVPEFLTLLHGVLDSPDIPLNVSRSYLQGDPNVKKISGHITKKVADRLEEIFKDNREDFENKWDDLKLFIGYGMMTEEKFYDRASKFALFKNTDGKYFTFEEYEKLIKENQTDKNKTLVYLYATDKQEQLSYIEKARKKGYDVLLMDGHLDTHYLNHLETKFKDSRFARVDSDTIDKLILKEDAAAINLTDGQQKNLSSVFEGQLPDKEKFHISFENMGETESPVVITQSEFTRRMKEMSELGGGQGFYGSMPDAFNMVVNAEHPLVIKVLESAEKSTGKKLGDLEGEIQPLREERSALEKEGEGKNEEEISQENKDKLEALVKQIGDLEEKQKKILVQYGGKNKLVRQLVDLALLSNNMLKGEELVNFVKRSVSLLK
jgi:molecular chaperone HtpG